MCPFLDLFVRVQYRHPPGRQAENSRAVARRAQPHYGLAGDETLPGIRLDDEHAGNKGFTQRDVCREQTASPPCFVNYLLYITVSTTKRCLQSNGSR